ncbi:hypothetical protein BHE74_00037857 [Ensete ventricosum]|nr:hypothetical protein GW17_00061763 [Ensete ventricosum]RWW55507.1 hypothetical protein BHE74_00037857 [Ensete ventricosum]
MATARPPTGAASHGLVTSKEATDYGQGLPIRGASGACKRRQTPAGCKRSPTRAAPMGRSVACKGCHVSPAGAVPARGQSAERRRPWRCRLRDRSRQ